MRIPTKKLLTHLFETFIFRYDFFIIFLVLCFMMVNDEKQLILKIIFIGDIHKQITLCISFSRGV